IRRLKSSILPKTVQLPFSRFRQNVADFTRLRTCNRVETSVQELTGDWRGYSLRAPGRARGGSSGSDVPTQRLARRLEGVPDLEGFLSYSARAATRRNLM